MNATHLKENIKEYLKENVCPKASDEALDAMADYTIWCLDDNDMLLEDALAWKADLDLEENEEELSDEDVSVSCSFNRPAQAWEFKDEKEGK